METTLLSSAAHNIIAGFNNGDDNSAVLENWKSLVSTLNQYNTYTEIPFLPEVPLAMYMYVMKYSSKRSEENSIRAITTFGVLMNAIENTENTKRLDYLALVSILLTYYKKHFNNVNNYSLFPITQPIVKEYFNETVTDWGNTTAYFDSIFISIYNLVDSNSQSFFGYEEIRNRFDSNKSTFFNEYYQKQDDIDESIDGKRVLKDCYERMNKVGKCPIFVPASTNSEIYTKTYGLIPQCLTFNVEKFFLHETSGIMSEGESNSQITIDMQEGRLELFQTGIDEQYLKSRIVLPIKDNYVKKIEQHIELNFDTRSVYLDNNHKYGNVDNVPTSMDLHFDHFALTQLVLTFIVGNQGYMRTIHLYGNVGES